jgi:hypothetical protein
MLSSSATRHDLSPPVRYPGNRSLGSCLVTFAPLIHYSADVLFRRSPAVSDGSVRGNSASIIVAEEESNGQPAVSRRER